jgi:hypothetical protein
VIREAVEQALAKRHSAAKEANRRRVDLAHLDATLGAS